MVCDNFHDKPPLFRYIYITLQVSKIFLSQQYIYILYIHDYTYIIIYIFFTENILHDITCIHISFTYILHIKHTWLYIHNHTHIYIYVYYITSISFYREAHRFPQNLSVSAWGHHPPRRDVVAAVHRGDGPVPQPGRGELVHGDPNHRGRGRPLAIRPWIRPGHGKRWVKSMGKSRENYGNIVEILANVEVQKLESEKV